MSELIEITHKIEDSEVLNPLYRIARNIKNGKAGNSFVYCLEEGKFYIYKNGYWNN